MAEMSAEEAALRKRARMEADLWEHLTRDLWDSNLRLGTERFEFVSCEDVPGYEDDNTAVLLRRKSDGQVLEADIDVTLYPARGAEPKAS